VEAHLPYPETLELAQLFATWSLLFKKSGGKPTFLTLRLSHLLDYRLAESLSKAFPTPDPATKYSSFAHSQFG
jgi:hypothetical protein